MYKLLFLIFPLLLVLGCNKNSNEPVVVTTNNNMMIVRVAFNNESFIEGEARWQQKIFGKEQGELNHYYSEISGGQFQFIPVQDAGPVHNGVTTLTRNSPHPNPRTNDLYFEEDLKTKVHPLLKETVEQIAAEGFDFSIYDKNSDGKITPDELIITFIFAGQEDAYAINNQNGIWAHQWCTENLTTIVNGVSIMSCDDDGSYAVFGERHDDHDATIGIIAHELGHVAFELPDLYYGSATRIGYYGLMSNGSWGQAALSGLAGDTPTHMCAWSKIDIGWYRPIVVQNSNEAATLFDTGSNSYNIYKVPLSNTSSEYFLLENRGTRGYDSGLNVINDKSTGYTGGVAIWHIDDAIITKNRSDNTVNASASHKGVDFEEANGASVDSGNGDPHLNFFYQGNQSDFTPYTGPNTNAYDGSKSNIWITNISTVSNAMTLNISN